MLRRVLACALVLLLAATVPVATARESEDSKGVTGPGDPITVLAGDSAPVDIYEPDGRNGVYPWGDIRNIEPLLPRWSASHPGWGIQPYTEVHTIDTATQTEWDEDWFKLIVPGADMTSWSQLSYRFDAFSMDRTVDLVLDVYADGSILARADALNGEDPAALVSNDDSRWGYYSQYASYGRWPSVTFVPPAAGTYWIRVRPYYDGPAEGFSGKAGFYTFRAKVGQVMRLAGDDRVATAVRISQEGWPSNPANSQDTAVILACSENYPDALAAASLAGAYGGPVLLTPRDRLPGLVKAEVMRVGARDVYVIGGTAAVSEAVITELATILPPGRIHRVAGGTRYETAVEVLKKTDEVLESKGQTMPKTAFLVSGENFPDALAVGPSAYHNRAPILLTTSGGLHPATASAIAMYGMTDVIIAGGTSAVSASVVSSLVDNGIPPNRIHRIAGVDRYETAKEVAAWACDLKGPGPRDDGRVGTTNNPTALYVLHNPHLNAYASGATFPDALAGGAFAGKARAPILLTPKSVGTPFLFGADGEIPVGSSQWFADLAVNGKLPIGQSYLLGGTAAVSDAVFIEIDNNTGWEP